MHSPRSLSVALALGTALACSSGTGSDPQGPGAEEVGDTVGDTEEGTSSESSDGSSSDSTGESTSADESSDDTGGVWEQQLVEVGHAREFRGVWVTTVYNINWPSSQGLSAAAAQAELASIVDTAEAVNLNAIVFQVRPESDAVYESSLEPWSRYLSGSQGGDPGFDPLAFLIEEAHARGIEVHAWFNPYRGAASAGITLAEPHIALQLPEHAHTYGSSLWMDPGALDVREHTVDVVLDVVERYAVDGVHLDDYFYPYPNGDDFPDALTWNAYLAGGGALSQGDWRRDNVNALVEELHDTIAAADPDARFGIAPFGIYRPGIPEGIVGLDQYAELYADPVLWMEEGWVDYLAPQLYWPTYSAQQTYEVLLDWWSSIDPERYVFTGNYLSKLGDDWTLDEMLYQVELSRLYSDQNSMGNVYFHVEPLQSDTLGINSALLDEFYGRPALTPPLADHLDDLVAPPLVTPNLEGNGALVEDVVEQNLRAFVVYADQGGAWALDRIVPIPDGEFGSTSLSLDSGTYAITAASRANVESDGVVLVVP